MGIFKKDEEKNKCLPQHKNLMTAYQYIKGVAIFAIILSAVTAMFSVVYTGIKNAEATQTLYILDKGTGEVMSIKKSRLADNRDIEVKANAELFITRFFDIDPTNWSEKINTALEMGDGSIYNVYNKFKESKWFFQLEQYSAFQKAKILSYNVDMTSMPYKVDMDVEVMFFSEMRQMNNQSKIFHVSFEFVELDTRTDATPHALYMQRLTVLLKNEKND